MRLNKGANHNKGTSMGLRYRPRVEDQLLHKKYTCRKYAKPLREKAPKARGKIFPLPNNSSNANGPATKTQKHHNLTAANENLDDYGHLLRQILER